MKNIFYIIIVLTLPIPWIIVKFSDGEFTPLVISLLSGIAIVGAAFLLSWACEISQKDISQGLAVAILALIAVLPEYAVDIYLAWEAGKNPEYISYATANMTGGNRLLIGIGWSLLIFLNFYKRKEKQITIKKNHSVDVTILLIATLYSFIIPLRGRISPFDFIPFFLIFCIYIYIVQKAEVIEPEIIGPPEVIANLNKVKRIPINLFFFIYSALVIFISADSFAEGLIATGKNLGIEEFILVQWLAPLASESPEIIVVSLFVLKGKVSQGMGALISSKINQWTLLIGMLPLVFSASSGKLISMPLDARQIEEILLTAAQSAFAVAILTNLSLSIFEGAILFILFITQLFFPATSIRYFFSFFYLFLTILFLIKQRKSIPELFKNTLVEIKGKNNS